jgi:hypothetical protein
MTNSIKEILHNNNCEFQFIEWRDEAVKEICSFFKDKEEVQTKLIELYEQQIEDLVCMSKIELGDDVIEEIKRLKEITGHK